jgi:hypothetical protein
MLFAKVHLRLCILHSYTDNLAVIQVDGWPIKHIHAG